MSCLDRLSVCQLSNLVMNQGENLLRKKAMWLTSVLLLGLTGWAAGQRSTPMLAFRGGSVLTDRAAAWHGSTPYAAPLPTATRFGLPASIRSSVQREYEPAVAMVPSGDNLDVG